MANKKYSDEEILIRDANKEDMNAVAEMIQELADFEKMTDGPKLSVKDLQHDGFEQQPPAFRCKVAELHEGLTAVGYALFFPTYSTWQGCSMMLEDLYVKATQRRRGVGGRLFDAVAKEASVSGCSRLEFHVLRWNEARAFYERLGARDISSAEGWVRYRLTGPELSRAALPPPPNTS